MEWTVINQCFFFKWAGRQHGPSKTRLKRIRSERIFLEFSRTYKGIDRGGGPLGRRAAPRAHLTRTRILQSVCPAARHGLTPLWHAMYLYLHCPASTRGCRTCAGRARICIRDPGRHGPHTRTQTPCARSLRLTGIPSRTPALARTCDPPVPSGALRAEIDTRARLPVHRHPSPGPRRCRLPRGHTLQNYAHARAPSCPRPAHHPRAPVLRVMRSAHPQGLGSPP
jgi:hypothetical protein